MQSDRAILLVMVHDVQKAWKLHTASQWRRLKWAIMLRHVLKAECALLFSQQLFSSSMNLVRTIRVDVSRGQSNDNEVFCLSLWIVVVVFTRMNSNNGSMMMMCYAMYTRVLNYSRSKNRRRARVNHVIRNECFVAQSNESIDTEW